MKGAEHYRRAESILASIEAGKFTTDASVANAAACAQVEATLALAAATAYPAVCDYLGGEDTSCREWTQVTS